MTWWLQEQQIITASQRNFEAKTFFQMQNRLSNSHKCLILRKNAGVGLVKYRVQVRVIVK